MFQLKKAFNASDLLKQLNGDDVKSVVSILKDGGEFCAFIETKEALLAMNNKEQSDQSTKEDSKEEKKKKVKNVPNPRN